MKADKEAGYKVEIARLNKVISVLCDRAELGVNSQSTDFSMFQTTVVLEEKVRARTAELKDALDSLASSNEELDSSLKELKITQNELVESKKMASLAGLVMGVAHELNTPIGVAITTVSIIENGCGQLVDAIKSDNLTRSALLSSLSDISEAAALGASNLVKSKDLVSQFKQVSAIKGKAECIDLSDDIQQLCLVMEEALAVPHLSISAEFFPNNIICDVDSTALNNVLTSLIYNSVQHAFDRQSSPRINIQVVSSGEFIDIVYRDNGSGFDSENVTKVFDPFFTTARRSGSSGLGLHIVFNIVTVALRGTIALTEWSDGAVFSIRFPCGAAV